MSRAANLLVAILAGAGAAVLLAIAAFISFIAGSPTMVAALASVILSVAMALWLARRRVAGAVDPGSWRKRIAALRRGMVAAFAAGVFALAVALAGYYLGFEPPPQAKVAAMLEEHRGDFEALREMVVADRLSGVIYGGESYAREPLLYRKPHELGIPSERAALYRQRMKAAGSPRIDVWNDGSIRFAMASWGAANRGWRMSLVWSKEKPTPLLPTIDGFLETKESGGGQPGYSALGDHWYAAIHW